MRLSVVNSKGGVGKSTLSVHLAVLLAKKGKTILIDTDPKQATAATWAEWRRETGSKLPSPVTVQLVGSAVLSEGRKLAADYKHMIIDAGGRDSSGLRCSLLLCERAIVPVGASDFDSAAIADLLDVIREASEFNQGLRVHFMLSRVDTRTRDGANMRKHLSDLGLNVLKAQIGERVAYRRATGDGLTVIETGNDQAAVAEITTVFQELMK